MITTNGYNPVSKSEPKKLGIITTANIPSAPKDQPAPKGSDPSKMITTHDEPKGETRKGDRSKKAEKGKE
jgi:hypothetical protein